MMMTRMVESAVYSVHHKMQEYNGRDTLLALLQACARQKNLHRGSKIHADVARLGLLGRDPLIGSTLISMYAKCGALEKAQEAFDKLPVRNVVIWTSLIAGYVQHGHGEEALCYFERMQLEGISPDAVTLTCILKACGSIGAANKGQEIHNKFIREGFLLKDITVGTALLSMYAKCGVIAKARDVFDKILIRDVIIWSSLMAGYVQCGHGEEALNCFKRMQLEGVFPNAVTCASALKACSKIGSADKGEKVHAEVIEKGFDKDEFVGTALVDMYVKCGLLAKAQSVFDKLHVQNVVSWSALIAGYTQHGHGVEALRRFEQMQLSGITPDAVTYVCMLGACGCIGAADKGREIHAEIVRGGFLEKHDLLGTALVDMYSKCGLLAKAHEVFNKLPAPNVVSWGALITGYAQHGHYKEALTCFEQMQMEGLFPNSVVFICILKVCGSIGSLNKGQELHAEIVRRKLLEDVSVGNALAQMYASCGLLAKAEEVFVNLSTRDAVSWSVLVAGYTQHGQFEKALNCFESMQHGDISPDGATFVHVLKACGSLGAADKGQIIHAEIVRRGLLEEHIAVGTALVDMYIKCGLVARAREVFDELPDRDDVSWSVLIFGYAQHGQCVEALHCFEGMQREGIFPDAVTLVCILKVCGNCGAELMGQEIHAAVVKEGSWVEDLRIGTALVDMYTKCGFLAKAHEVFHNLPVRDVVLWNALITGSCLLGNANAVFYLLNRMIEEGVKPDLVTSTCVLNACSHAGLLDEGQVFFEAMSTLYGIIPTLEHHTCMIDLFVRAGLLDRAIRVIKEMPFSADLAVWLIIMRACQKLRNVGLGKVAFEHAMHLDEKNAATYICMSMIYSGAGSREDAPQLKLGE